MISFDKENVGTWCYFDKSNKDLGGVCMQPFTAQETRRVTKACTTTKKKYNKKTGVYYDDVQTDDAKFDKFMWRYVIVDWKGVGLSGKEIKCTEDNIDKMIAKRDFYQFVNSYIEEINDDNTTIENAIKEAEEARVKNSGTTSPGKQ